MWIHFHMQAQPETLQTVQSTIAKQLSVDESTVTPHTKFADLGADSLDTVCSFSSFSLLSLDLIRHYEEKYQ